MKLDEGTQSEVIIPEDVGDPRDVNEEDIEEDLDEDMAEDLVHDDNDEPRPWRNSLLLVCDPFIFAKNAAGGIHPQAITRFRAECVRSAQVIASGRPIQEILGSNKAINDFRNMMRVQHSFVSPANRTSSHSKVTEEEQKAQAQAKELRKKQRKNQKRISSIQ